ncbi:MAG: hypothetical protein CR217_18275 [Beijerinckiaceae bacterium]|nr:MAG: hypothetical protein CR217_18275 [Beijerinckiaceae bacterium]
MARGVALLAPGILNWGRPKDMILSDRLSAKVLHFLNLCLESEDGLDQNAGIDPAAHLRSLGTAPVLLGWHRE